MNENTTIQLLCKEVEQKAGRRMTTTRDFDFLSESILEKTREKVSSTTLKRIWGYLSEPTIPRLTTLNILAQYLDYTCWEDFSETHEHHDEEVASTEPENKPQTILHAGGHRNQPKVLLTIATIAVVIFALLFLWSLKRSYKPDTLPGYVFQIGQKFASPHDYLHLFGIYAKDSLWGQVLPHHPHISVWGPQYHHPVWHNDGDAAAMMPTITERWEPEGADSQIVITRNFDQFKHYDRLNEIRITFMKNLTDSNYVFLGAYRLSKQLSDTTHCVWERVAEKVAIDHLDYLEELRN